MAQICKKCLLREMAEADAKMIEKYKEAIKKEDQVSESEYERRLTVCKTCEFLNAGTCGACGCYVELRAAAAVSKCPYKNGDSSDGLLPFFAVILLHFFHRGVAKADFDILAVIAERFSKDRKSADVPGIVLYSQAEADAAAAVEMEIIDFNVGYFETVDIGTFLIDDKLF